MKRTEVHNALFATVSVRSAHQKAVRGAKCSHDALNVLVHGGAWSEQEKQRKQTIAKLTHVHSVKATLPGGTQEAVRGATGGIKRLADRMCRSGQEALQLTNAMRQPNLSMVDRTDSGCKLIQVKNQTCREKSVWL